MNNLTWSQYEGWLQDIKGVTKKWGKTNSDDDQTNANFITFLQKCKSSTG